MTEKDLHFFKAWFSDFTKSFYSSNEEDQKNIMLKVEHTHNVCKNIVEISQSSSFSENQIRVAEAIALFHDMGRFPQYAEYKTFRDAVSVNHGLLGSKILIKENVLLSLPSYEQQLIVQAVKFHNAFAIPPVLNDETVLFLKLIRDADKADIFRVFIEYYESQKQDRASATAFGMPDTPECSAVMLSCILNKKVASYSNIRTENDFKLMKLSWLYDIHFTESIRLMQRKNYIDSIINKLPQTDEVISAIATLKGYISERLNTKDS
jgi:hypothetical protein